VRDALGQPGSRQLLATPALVCDLDLLKGNISTLGATIAEAGVALRPHVKSHKSAYIAQLQLEAGASGLSFAKLSEAEAVVEELRDQNFEPRVSVLMTSTMVGDAAARRACALAKDCDLSVVVDHLGGVDELALAARDAQISLSVLCDVDVGLGRSGVTGSDEALRVVERITNDPHLHFAGVQGYGGHLQHIAGRDQRRESTASSMRQLSLVIEALESRGLSVDLRTGGGTGTSAIDLELGVLNELQCGSYIFMDRQYSEALGHDIEGRFAQSLFIETSVASDNQAGFVTVDAGLKAMATEAGPPRVVGYESVDYRFFGDEQGLVTRPAEGSLQRGDRLMLLPPHCDPTVDKYDVIWLVRDDVVLDVIHVVARGSSQ
jgi:D-serine deaminase-like pyridoxal phosphate-dependent protein